MSRDADRRDEILLKPTAMIILSPSHCGSIHLPKYITIALISVISLTIVLWQALSSQPEAWQKIPSIVIQATRLRSADILSQAPGFSHEHKRMPRYIHQSSMNDDFSMELSGWSRSCHFHHPEWEWIIWTEEDTVAVIGKRLPWFSATYEALPTKTDKADAARIVYMYLFGGVYVDADTECLKPFDHLFTSHGVLMDNDGRSNSSIPAAFFGHMDLGNTEITLLNTIPNAWMAATPGHTIFLLILIRLTEAVMRHSRNGRILLDDITGSARLYQAIEIYDNLMEYGLHLRDVVSIDTPSNLFEQGLLQDRLVVLPPENIFPYAWNRAGGWYHSICNSGKPHFNRKMCKQLVTTRETYSITYWNGTLEAVQ